MKLAIVRQTYNPNGGAERFVSRALNVLAQDTSLDVTLIARQWEDAAGWKTLTVNPPFRKATNAYREPPSSGQATVFTPPGLSNMAAFCRRWRAGRNL